jgi:hypothetical protein
MYLNANLALKEEILAKTNPVKGKPGRYRPTDHVLSFLNGLWICRRNMPGRKPIVGKKMSYHPA